MKIIIVREPGSNNKTKAGLRQQLKEAWAQIEDLEKQLDFAEDYTRGLRTLNTDLATQVTSLRRVNADLIAGHIQSIPLGGE